jgi:3-mercaptopyruvate sulfurtransferase SseA
MATMISRSIHSSTMDEVQELLHRHSPIRSCSSVQGATFWDWTADGLQHDTNVPVQLDLNPDTFAAAAAEKGIGSDRPVVLYDEGTSGSMFACRCQLCLPCR